jgi:hypothetical protein
MVEGGTVSHEDGVYNRLESVSFFVIIFKKMHVQLVCLSSVIKWLLGARCIQPHCYKCTSLNPRQS